MRGQRCDDSFLRSGSSVNCVGRDVINIICAYVAGLVKRLENRHRQSQARALLFGRGALSQKGAKRKTALLLVPILNSQTAGGLCGWLWKESTALRLDRPPHSHAYQAHTLALLCWLHGLMLIPSLPNFPPQTNRQQAKSNTIINPRYQAMAKPKVPPPHGRRAPRPGGRLAGIKKKKHPSIKNQIRSLQRRLQKQGGGGEGGGAGDGGTQV